MAIFTYALNTSMPDACRTGVLTIGNFDGVHLGHQALLAETVRQARLLNGPAVAVTFDPHPSAILRPDRVQRPLTTLEDRVVLLQQSGIDHVLVLQTSPALLQLRAQEFFDEIIVDRLRARALVEGYNFAFGRGREGTTEILRGFCADKGVPLTVLAPQEILGQPVSSSRVRTELLAGAVDVVAQLLGRAYRITGVVGAGQKRGKTIGFPTANLDSVRTLLPDNGVYAVRAIHDGKTWAGAANIGPNPTFGDHVRKIEVHLLGYAGNLYEQSLTVEFVARIRGTRAFGSVQELVAQIQRDVDEVKQLLRVE